MIREAVRRGAPRVIVAGGDGTVQAAANALCGSATTLAIVPAGTANDFARALGIPADPGAALAVALNGRPVPVDLGRAEFRTGVRIFANYTQIGFGTLVSRITARLVRVLRTPAMYPPGIAVALPLFRPRAARICIDGRRCDVRSLAALIVANGPRFGGGLLPAPNARMDDGLFDVLLVEGLTQAGLAVRLPLLRVGPPKDDPNIRTFRARVVEIESALVPGLDADGEFLGGFPVRLTVLPRALRVAIPASPQGRDSAKKVEP